MCVCVCLQEKDYIPGAVLLAGEGSEWFGKLEASLTGAAEGVGSSASSSLDDTGELLSPF